MTAPAAEDREALRRLVERVEIRYRDYAGSAARAEDEGGRWYAEDARDVATMLSGIASDLRAILAARSPQPVTTTVTAIRARDAEVVPRMMPPGGDPLLQAEMDRRWLLADRDRLTSEVDRLARWKAEALDVLDRWETVWKALGQPGAIGCRKPDAARAAVEQLKTQVEGAR
ncbi:hypothetical protein [Cellulomonas gilvus]|uniref:Uncharacterized protein n=1 Tax=Cellulomonas gilvus (strain ATCC 13127 / NRRL B-14078) TaxID=593907 RepID=F8A2H7_CELGA|nr:hypothetical protein [Cellulomonas gilvus]AEI11834.1 hypothetical protein Celgi_1315 [Cellulomonas gilvus ATCC 13127]